MNLAGPTDPTTWPRVLFVTGRLAEASLRQVLAEVAPRVHIRAEVAVLPISVAALMTPRWVTRHLTVPPGVSRVLLPGHCRGDLAGLTAQWGVPVEAGPEDLRDLGRVLGAPTEAKISYGQHSIEILAEINHAPRLSLDQFLAQADQFRCEGADRIDVGCDPDGGWTDVGRFVAAWVQERGGRASVDSFDPAEVASAVAGGADLVLSVNATNRGAAPDWGVEVVAIPDVPGTLDGLDATVEYLEARGLRYRIDPILEPIGFGFAASLGRYLETRRRWPGAAILMGIGNLTELTDVDSAGMNMALIGFCQEVGVRSVLTTAVTPWARSAVAEANVARQLAYHAVTQQTLPKRVDSRLIMLRDPRVPEFGDGPLAEMARLVRDPNWRIYAEGGQIHAFNNAQYLKGTDPFLIFSQMNVNDPAHAFYLGHELCKAKTALTLHKSYRQDQALDWGFLTMPEVSHRLPRKPAALVEPLP